LIGDDINAACKSAQERWGVPVVPIDCAGFYSTTNLGNRIAGEFWHVLPLLDELGLRVLCMLLSDINQECLNKVVHPVVLLAE
jgi:nitrogenase molybdenum-cofactor synthesis protein NifE